MRNNNVLTIHPKIISPGSVIEPCSQSFGQNFLLLIRVTKDGSDIPSDPKKIITKGFSTVFYPTGYSE